MIAEERGREAAARLEALRAGVRAQVVPALEASVAQGGALPDTSSAHIDGAFALGFVLVLNLLCYYGLRLSDAVMWLGVNVTFLSFVACYEKLARRLDSTVQCANRTISRLEQGAGRSVVLLRSLTAAEAKPKPLLSWRPLSGETLVAASDADSDAGAGAGAGAAASAQAPAPPRPSTPPPSPKATPASPTVLGMVGLVFSGLVKFSRGHLLYRH